MDTPANEPRFVSCRCQHCDDGIEFDASDFQKGETRKVECPHCHLETIIFVPVPTNAPKPKQITTTPSKPNLPAANPSPGQKELFSIKVTSRTAAIFFAFTMFCLASILVWEHLPSRSQPGLGKQTPSRAQPVPADTISKTSPDTETVDNSIEKTSAIFQGDILNVSKNRIVLSTFTIEKKQQAVVVRRLKANSYMTTDESKKYHDVTEMVDVGEEKVPGRKIILRNYPTNLDPAVGQTISFRAMRVGTSDYSGDVLELWNYQSQAATPAQ